MDREPGRAARPPGIPRRYRSLKKRLAAVRAGLSETAHAPREVMLQGKMVPSAGVIARIDEFLKGYQGITELLSRVEEAHLALRQEMPTMDALWRDLQDALRVYHGRHHVQLAYYGIKPVHQPRPMTSETAVVRSAKAALTRKARGTLGPRQKAGIKERGTFTVGVGVKKGK